MIPDYCQALTAHRCWNVHANGLLVGQAHNDPWPPYHPMVARCGYVMNAVAHLQDGALCSAPVLQCACGIYGLKTASAMKMRLLDQIHSSLFGTVTFGAQHHPDTIVWGTVQLWGRVIEHEIGYRAEFAYPSALWCEDAALASTVASLYGVPCEVTRLPRPEPEGGIDEGLTYALVNRMFTIGMPQARGVLTPSQFIVPTSGPTRDIGASRYQQQQDAAKRDAAALTVDWRDRFKKGFYAP